MSRGALLDVNSSRAPIIFNVEWSPAPKPEKRPEVLKMKIKVTMIEGKGKGGDKILAATVLMFLPTLSSKRL